MSKLMRLITINKLLGIVKDDYRRKYLLDQAERIRNSQ